MNHPDWPYLSLGLGLLAKSKQTLTFFRGQTFLIVIKKNEPPGLYMLRTIFNLEQNIKMAHKRMAISDRHKDEPPGLSQGNSKTRPSCLWPVK